MPISKLPLFRLFAAVIVMALVPGALAAQDDANANETPLGDVARNLRKKTSGQGVIDNDNLQTVMEQVAIRKLAGSALQYSIDSGGKTFQVSSPDGTCRLAFSANAKALLTSQYAQMQLPPSDLAKLEGPATIDGSSLQVSVFNGTDWHVSEVAIAVTLVTRADAHEGAAAHGSGKLVPAVAKSAVQAPGKPAERPADVTTLYRVRAAAAPATTTLFRTPLDSMIGPDQEWHWAIVEAKGYPPERAVQAKAVSNSR